MSKVVTMEGKPMNDNLTFPEDCGAALFVIGRTLGDILTECERNPSLLSQISCTFIGQKIPCEDLLYQITEKTTDLKNMLEQANRPAPIPHPWGQE